MIFIWVYWIVMAYKPVQQHLLTILSHAGLDNYNGRQIEHLIGDRLRGPSLMSLWNVWGWF